jgi:multiple sugar transport system ATP-binding protein
VGEAAEVLSLTEWIDRKPAQLSGGQCQRVAMGRAIVREPAAFLMDEPLSNLDAKLRVEIRAEVSRIQRHLGVATMYVTHDQTEAMTMGDRVAVMNAGVLQQCDHPLQQCDHPQVVYDSPSNLFVAGFMGSPAMSLYEATVAEDLGSVRLGSQSLPLPAELTRDRAGLKAYAGRRVVVGLRPETLSLGADRDGTGALTVDVELVEALGSEQLLHFSIDARRLSAPGIDAEDDVGEVAGAGVPRVEPHHEVKASERVRLAVQTKAMHFFDPENGVAITA